MARTLKQRKRMKRRKKGLPFVPVARHRSRFNTSDTKQKDEWVEADTLGPGYSSYWK